MAKLRSAISWSNDKTYLLYDNDTYAVYNSITGLQEDSELGIGDWHGLPRSPDAFVWWGVGKAFAFTGAEYLRYDGPSDQVDPGYPLAIGPQWPGLPTGAGGGPDWRNGIDAAVNWGNGKLYLFKGDAYVRYDITADRVDPGYPVKIADRWTGVFPANLDAVTYAGGRYAYFFRGGQYQRFDLDADHVDDSGTLDASFRFAPTPSGGMAPARLLTLAQANGLMADLIRRGKLTLKSPPFVDGPTGIVSPKPAQRVVVSPPAFDGIRYTNQIAPASTIIDNLDQRMLVALYRLTRWTNSSAPDIAELLHLGIGHGGPDPKDCHNQGRAIDLSAIKGEVDGAGFTRSVLKHWGELPRPPGVKVRISPSADPLAYGLFTTVFRFGTFECEGNGIGPQNKWPMPELGEGGFVIYPDHKNPGLAAAHQNHFHIQVGVTRLP
ncbi:hemopexin repeat-containing protein [Streptomyces sp. NPDC093546]|uniref:hemopexin repeat-containing protein n=1 Tax=Streptomyces sp. NPDC093546 TaxID=3366040 RepID=UPI0037FFE834